MSAKNEEKKVDEKKVTEQLEVALPEAKVITSPTIRVVHGGQNHDFQYEDLGLVEDAALVSDNTVRDALQKAMTEKLGQEILLPTHEITRLENGNWVSVGPATFGC